MCGVDVMGLLSLLNHRFYTGRELVRRGRFVVGHLFWLGAWKVSFGKTKTRLAQHMLHRVLLERFRVDSMYEA